MSERFEMRLSDEDTRAIEIIQQRYTLKTAADAVRKALEQTALERAVKPVEAVQVIGDIPHNKPWYDGCTEFVSNGELWIRTENSHRVKMWKHIIGRSGL